MTSQQFVLQHWGLGATAPAIGEFRQVLRLAKRHSSTLGFLPNSAFADRIRKGTLVVARRGDELVGYCLYDLPRAGYIKLVHVCVADTARGAGLGKALIDAAIEQNPNAMGVLAYCRRDYAGLDKFWSGAGLTPRGEREGRALRGSILTAWWRPLGDLDLIDEAALSSGLPLVVYDTNIVSDLYALSDADRPERSTTLGLLAGWLQAAIAPVVSPWVDVELNRISDRWERERQRLDSQELPRLRSKLAEDSATLDELTRRIGADELAKDPSLHDDLHHVADAINAGAEFVVTNDTNLIRVASAAVEGRSPLQILRPHELVARILSRTAEPVFQSRFIESVDLEWQAASTHEVDQLVTHFTAHELNERGKGLERAIREALSNHPRTTRVLVDRAAKPWALLAERRRDGELIVDLFRVARMDSAATVAIQLARHLRVLARDNGLRQVRVVDEHLTALGQQALERDGYELGAFPTARLLADRVDASSLHHSHGGRGVPAIFEVRAYERKYWPLVLINAEVPTVLVPIQPRYAERLFGLDIGALWLQERKRGLGLSREHVYYSGFDKALPTEGARILWYVTSDKLGTMRQIMASSRSLGCERKSPEEAHAGNSKIGVFGLKDVQEAADKHGMVTVVRFEDSEILDRPIGGSELQELFRVHHVNQPIQSFRNVRPALFDDIVRRQPRKNT